MATRDRSLLLTLSLATALTLASVSAVSTASHAASVIPAASTVPTDVRRNVTWYGVPFVAPRNLHIESQSVGAVTPDEYQISYADGNFTLVYQRVAGGPIANQYTLSVRGLLEWNDTMSDGHVEDGSAVAYTELGPGAFGKNSIVHTAATAAGGVEVDSFLILSNKQDLAINLTIANGFVVLPSGQTLTPMEAKLSLEINHTMTTPGTRLALHLGLSTSQQARLENQSWDDLNEFSSDDSAVNITNHEGGGASSTFFAWSNTSTVNGEVGRVAPSGLLPNETTGDYDLYLSYPQPSTGDLHLQIVHDPTIGVVSGAYLAGLQPPHESPLPFRSDAVVYAVSLVAIAALVAGTALLVRRRARKQP